jgi:hypothetical protein
MKVSDNIMPTPVSALLHAATLVTAGVYLMLRSSPILEFAPTALIVIIWLGAVTSFFAASTGLLQNDMKRIIAFSTVSQLGLDANLTWSLSFNVLLLITKYILILFTLFYSFFYFKFFGKSFFSMNIDIGYSITILGIISSWSHKKFSTNTLLSQTQKDNYNIQVIDKYNEFDPLSKLDFKSKYNKVPGVYMWVNHLTHKSYVGRSKIFYSRLNNYLSPYYLNKNKNKMPICSSLLK